jgi:predicted Zn-dependent protease
MRRRSRPTVRACIGLAAALLLASCGADEEPAADREVRVERGAAGDDASAESSELPIPAPVAGDREKAALHVARAREALEGGEPARARLELDAAVAADPACADALELLGWMHLEPGPDVNDGAALVCFTKLEKLGVKSASVLGGAGVARSISGDAAGARPRLEVALASGELEGRPDRLVKVHLALARLDADSGRAAEAEAHVLRALELEPLPFRRAIPLALHGELLAETGRLDESERRLREAIAADAEHVKAHHQLARVLARLGRPEEAARETRIQQILSKLRELTGSKGQPDVEAEVRLTRELVTIAPEHDDFAIANVRTLLKARRYAEAEKEIAAVAKRKKLTSGLAFLLARARAGQGDLSGAEKARATMLQLDPKAPAALDREILEEWRRGAPDVSDDTLDLLLARWSRR